MPYAAYSEPNLTSGQTYYAKPDQPLNTTWATGVVALTEVGTTGQFGATTLVDGTSYAIYQQSGGSPAAGDTYAGQRFTPTAGQVAKIQRANTDLADGESVNWVMDQVNSQFDVQVSVKKV